MKKVSEILKKFRKDNKLTQPDLGQMLSVSQQYISQVETNRSQLSEDILNTLKKLMQKNQYDELEQAFYFEKMPEKLRNLIEPAKIKIPYFKDVNASAGNGILNFCEMDPESFLEIENKYNHKKCIAINIKGDSMWPELQDLDVAIVDCSNKIPSNRGFFVVKYKDEIFAKKLIMNEGNVIALKSINPMYKDIELNLNNEFEIIGIIESVYREFFN